MLCEPFGFLDDIFVLGLILFLLSALQGFQIALDLPGRQPYLGTDPFPLFPCGPLPLFRKLVVDAQRNLHFLFPDLLAFVSLRVVPDQSKIFIRIILGLGNNFDIHQAITFSFFVILRDGLQAALSGKQRVMFTVLSGLFIDHSIAFLTILLNELGHGFNVSFLFFRLSVEISRIRPDDGHAELFKLEPATHQIQ